MRHKYSYVTLKGLRHKINNFRSDILTYFVHDHLGTQKGFKRSKIPYLYMERSLIESNKNHEDIRMIKRNQRGRL